jgi:hypothetical protein
MFHVEIHPRATSPRRHGCSLRCLCSPSAAMAAMAAWAMADATLWLAAPCPEPLPAAATARATCAAQHQAIPSASSPEARDGGGLTPSPRPGPHAPPLPQRASRPVCLPAGSGQDGGHARCASAPCQAAVTTRWRQPPQAAAPRGQPREPRHLGANHVRPRYLANNRARPGCLGASGARPRCIAPNCARPGCRGHSIYLLFMFYSYSVHVSRRDPPTRHITSTARLQAPRHQPRQAAARRGHPRDAGVPRHQPRQAAAPRAQLREAGVPRRQPRQAAVPRAHRGHPREAGVPRRQPRQAAVPCAKLRGAAAPWRQPPSAAQNRADKHRTG